ncbi:calcium/sodium antiporter [Pseudoponticoccus marisrubri]|uniref:Sodium:calcium antiporter n=1 Tax=Pseudoponticoccus marisrubri TaxID=1685382 RepID=A0A0W7WKY1_9RHOB|nr:calcium/sodium antiporter [Pseudoponticoccus marisrubri]KUF11250.1 sodium:calcium antiporter [Pseudoponticoccus marisrubri]
MVWLELLGGLVLLLAGGEALVRGSVGVATRLGVSPLVIGLTLVGFGTSMPELVASVQAASAGAPGLAVGNIVGSNIANILLILGTSAVIYPMATSRNAFRRDGSVLIAVSLLLVAVALIGTLGRLAGGIFIALLGAYTVSTYLAERAGAASAERRSAEADDAAPAHMGVLTGLALTAGGIAGVVFGAGFLVDSAIVLARGFGLSEAVIGLTLVAVGTSLPELVTSVMAALRRHSDVAFGNVVGSNIFNILGIGGVTALVSPIEVPRQIIVLDVWAMLLAAALLVVFAVTGWRLSRREGAIFLALYIGYLALQLSPALRSGFGLA